LNPVLGDPVFVDAINADFHIQSSSPCKDTGTPTGAPGTDYEGNARPSGNAHDIGAYEFHGTNTAPSLTSPVPGSQLAPASQTFTWQANGAQDFWLYAGTVAGSGDLYDSGALNSATSATITGLSVRGGGAVYIRLWYRVGGSSLWLFVDEIYTAVASVRPGQASLLSPEGGGSGNTPVYSWRAVPGSTWYYLWVNDSSGNVIKKWYTAAQAGCITGSGTCSVQNTTAVSGSSIWWVLTWNRAGHGPWSAGMHFTP
jgi:hypothetical protein